MNDGPDTQWQIGADGRITASEVWLEIVGRSQVDAPGYCWLDYVHEEERDRIGEEVAAHLAARRPFEVVFRARHQNGRYVWVHTEGEPQADGGYLGWTRIARSGLRPVRRIAEVAVGLALIVA